MRKRVLITGGCGFIGSNLVRYILRERPDWSVVNLDALTYAGDPRTLEGVDGDERYSFIHGSINTRRTVDRALEGVDTVVHLAAESHVDRSISEAGVFVRTNVIGTQVLARAAAARGVSLFLHASTDEVYGPDASEAGLAEDAPLKPSSPYAASKAASEGVVRSAASCWGLPMMITRSTNNFGPWQHPEKLIPRFVTNLVRGQTVPVYGDGLQTREWLHVEPHCAAMVGLIEGGRVGETYNIGSGHRVTNLQVARLILEVLGEDESKIEHVADRLGHDRGYAVDSSKIRDAIGWREPDDWAERMQQTIAWYLTHSVWWGELVERGP